MGVNLFCESLRLASVEQAQWLSEIKPKQTLYSVSHTPAGPDVPDIESRIELIDFNDC